MSVVVGAAFDRRSSLSLVRDDVGCRWCCIRSPIFTQPGTRRCRLSLVLHSIADLHSAWYATMSVVVGAAFDRRSSLSLIRDNVRRDSLPAASALRRPD